MSPGFYCGQYALLFLVAEGADEPVEFAEILLQEGFKVGRLRLEIGTVTTEHEQQATVTGRDHAAVAIIEEAL